jgi:hypothetical protein
MDIGVGVVQDIVLYLPVIDIAGKNVHASPHYLIDPGLTRIGPVVGIVHNVHAHPGHSDTNDNGQKELNPYGHANG